MDQTQYQRRVAWLAAVVLAPLLYLMLVHGPVAQSAGYHGFADARTVLGLRNFANVASNLVFLLVGAGGWSWCYRNLKSGARQAWMVFFAGVALVCFGSGYYHTAPDDKSLVWDRLPMTLAFTGLLVALLGEHLGAQYERRLLLPALIFGIASVAWWRYSGDLRVYIWVQAAPLLAIPLVLMLFPGRYSHRIYLLYALGLYLLAKVVEIYDVKVFELTASVLSGHSLKHLLAALAPGCLWLMLRRRTRLR